MKKLILCLLFLPILLAAQQYNNEWIDFSKTYYKFKIAESGLYRIPQSAIASAGLANTPAEQFRLFRNGKEVPLFTSSVSGVLPASGFIEFFGEMNDGKADRALYRRPNFQHTDKWSLQTDTAVYFLTTSTGANLRFREIVNNVAANTLPAEPFFMYTSGTYFKNKINPGFANVVGEYVHSSSYDNGEFWTSQDVAPNTPLTNAQNNLFPASGGTGAVLRYGATGNANNARTIRVSVNGTVLRESAMDYFNDTVTQASLPVSLLSTGNASVQFVNTSAVPTDRLSVSFYEITYPRLFNFGGSNRFSFQLPAKPSGYYLEIRNFSFGSTVPVLYDLDNNERFAAQLTGDVIKFALPAKNVSRNLVLLSQDESSVKNIAGITQKTFVDFREPANQGNYLIISNPLLYAGANNSNPVQAYAAYRSSVAGGRYNPHIYDINELVDQFAFGIKKHPLSVKNFVRFAKATFSTNPQYVFLVGRGVAYNEYCTNQQDPLADRLNLVPSFGYPSSDNLLCSADLSSAMPLIPVGRISVVNATELEDYLQKVKEYELAQQTSANTIQGRLWMKNMMHVTGASESYLGTVLCNYMAGYKKIAEDTLVGANVNIFCKSSTNPVEQLSNDRIAQLFQDGISLVNYFGHSSSTTLEFNLDNPQNYNNAGKYPVFSVNGCNAGNFFTFDPQRFTFNETLSEKFVLAKQRGAIAFIASTHYGVVNYLNIFINSLYNDMASTKYSGSLGEIVRDALQKMVTIAGVDDFFARGHAEEITLHGDPALVMNFQPKPDYVIEDAQVKFSPAFLSVSASSFDLSVKMYNLGKAIKDSIILEVKRQYPDGNIEMIYRKKIRGIYYQDSLLLNVPVIATRDKGSNKIIVTLDAENAVDEISENNNSFAKELFIYEDEAKPAYPANLSIVSNPAQKLYASTANPFSTQKQYSLEIDTTALFNSSQKVIKNVTSAGGLLEFDSGISFKDSTVYYWRTALVPPANESYRWNNASFTYIPGNVSGFSQAHYFQHLDSKAERISLNQDRKWQFGQVRNDIYIRQGTWGTGVVEEAGVSLSVNGRSVAANACAFSSLVISVFDPVTFKPWVNVTDPGTGMGRYGSYANNCYPGRTLNFEYRYTDTGSRHRLMNFIENVIPTNAYVVIRSFAVDPSTSIYGIPPYNNFPQAFVSDWKADTAYFGSNRSLYHTLLQQGLTAIDSFTRPRNFAYVYKKGDAAGFQPKTVFTEGVYDEVLLAADCPTPDTLGFVTSPKFGPAKQWKNMQWSGSSIESNSTDAVAIEVYGFDKVNQRIKLLTINKDVHDADISSIDAAQFPYLQLVMRNSDSINLSPYQLKQWRLLYTPVPEGALAPNLFFVTKDTIEVGERINFGIGFKNISQAAFDSLKLKLVIIDKDNVSHPLSTTRKKPLPVGDTLMLRFDIDSKDFPGMNTLYLDVNPDGDQPELYHDNNFLYRTIYVKPDLVNPLLDVTFDGVHILNRDIVSAKPRIQIKLKDNARFLLLNDTSLLNVQVRFPDQANTVRNYKFDNDTLRFIPAQSASDNTATIEFSPAFNAQINPEGDEYELIVKGKDRAGNKAGQTAYRVSFQVINKPMISNLLNYPNPFTTSTAFVFTITGSELPQNMKIQVLTVTGKIVREITKDELGNIHIGRNITDFKWDGTDQFGQRLANGVYLYRVVTTMNGKQMEKYRAEGDTTDKFFTRGYGKMYLMR